MKILITPRSFAKADAAPLETLKAAGCEIVMNPKAAILTQDEMIECLAGCDGVIIGVDPLNREVLQSAPQLKAISKYGVGMDNIDLEYAKERGIRVSKTLGANSEAVADYAFALMLACARKLLPIDAKCRKADWSKTTSLDVFGQTLGLIGLGAIGKAVVRRAKGFNMRILANEAFWDEAYAAENGIERATVDEICQKADFISLHVPLLPETQGLINEARIRMMKQTCVVINTARGGLIDEDALLCALKENRIFAAGLDAFASEPPENGEWFALDNVVIGSHCGASTQGAVNNMSAFAAENLLRDLGIVF